jgi:hypothetical protein
VVRLLNRSVCVCVCLCKLALFFSHACDLQLVFICMQIVNYLYADQQNCLESRIMYSDVCSTVIARGVSLRMKGKVYKSHRLMPLLNNYAGCPGTGTYIASAISDQSGRRQWRPLSW